MGLNTNYDLSYNREMKSKLVPEYSQLVPSKDLHQMHLERQQLYPPEKFETYNDWFYFIHVDPIIRWWHAIGMMIGLLFYIIAAYETWIFGLGLKVMLEVLIGVFFFFFLPLISHYVYDGGGTKSTPDKFHSTFIPVVHINLLTLTGRYDRWLRKFIQKYPFTVKAWKLHERKVD